MDDVLVGIVLERLEKSPLAGEATDLLLAAFESEESLSAQLSGQAVERSPADQACATLPGPAGAYLRSLVVCGFRGIGEPATLELQPGPGLTVVVGRNGSGKSSFAEALEVLAYRGASAVEGPAGDVAPWLAQHASSTAG